MLEAAYTRNETELKDENKQLVMKLQLLKLNAEKFHMELFKDLKPGYIESIDHLKKEIELVSEQLQQVDKLFEQFDIKFNQGQMIYEQIENSVEVAMNQFQFIHTMNEIKAKELEEIERTNQGSEHHVELQNLAKNARLTADMQVTSADEIRDEIKRYIVDATNALDYLNVVVKGQKRLETEKEFNILELDYGELKANLDGLIEEAKVQKVELESKAAEATQMIEKLAEFVIPDEMIESSDEAVIRNQKSIQKIAEQVILK